MNRRNFIKSAVLLSTAVAVKPVMATVEKQASVNVLPDPRRFNFIQNYNIKAPEGSKGVVNLWIPLPEKVWFQKFYNIEFNGNYKEAFITTNNSYAAKTLFATWDSTDVNPAITVKMLIETLDFEPLKNGELINYKAPKHEVYPIGIERYLNATAHMPVDGIVKETADKITKGNNDPLKKAELIYQWVSTNMFRDNSVIGCGTGDVADILKSGKLGGKCTDINSVFVALARAAGIPAREMFGIRLGKSIKLAQYSKTAFGGSDAKGFYNATGSQHCRAEFYLAGYGWIPCDAADVTKMRLTEKKENSHPDVQAVNKYLFGNWEMNWVGFNYGRDFVLYPTPEQLPINNFGYPYAEVDGDPLNYYDPKVFSYDYQSQEL